jgi:hypothetical protein
MCELGDWHMGSMGAWSKRVRCMGRRVLCRGLAEWHSAAEGWAGCVAVLAGESSKEGLHVLLNIVVAHMRILKVVEQSSNNVHCATCPGLCIARHAN